MRCVFPVLRYDIILDIEKETDIPYNSKNKVDILNRLEKGETSSSLAKVFEGGKATITDIKKKE